MQKLFLWLGGSLILGSLFPAASQSSLLINEIMYNTDKKSQEWFELYNPGAVTVNLANWSIRDSRKKIVITARSFSVPAQSYVIISNAVLVDSLLPITIVNNSLPEWNNGGDDMVLYDELGLVSDSLTYDEDWGGGRFISLERLRCDGVTSDPANWASCIDPSGHTAGRSNSVHAPDERMPLQLAVSPSPFSPDQDGIDDLAAISFELPMSRATVHIKIYDRAGRLVRYLANCLDSGPQHTVYWDGHDDLGRTCRIGVYIVYLQAIDEYAGNVEQAKGVCVLARK